MVHDPNRPRKPKAAPAGRRVSDAELEDMILKLSTTRHQLVAARDEVLQMVANAIETLGHLELFVQSQRGK